MFDPIYRSHNCYFVRIVFGKILAAAVERIIIALDLGLSKLLNAFGVSSGRFVGEEDRLEFFTGETGELIVGFFPGVVFVFVVAFDLVLFLGKEEHSVPVLHLIIGHSMFGFPGLIG